MRPIRLQLENFGAYRERAEVDFAALGAVFLVWGKTGSGKTTLFDAISYALYGEAPGSRRQLPRELHSHFAAPGAKPLVEFEFALASGRWKATRSPPYARPARGGGTTVTAQAARLERLSGEVWKVEAEGPAAVDEVIKKQLGLSAEEFSKIILLPQGEFQRFLEMDTSERVKILEKLFPVDLHDRVTALAQERAKAALAAGRHLDAEITRLHEEGAGPEGEAEVASLIAREALLEEGRRAALSERLKAETELERGREDFRRRSNLERAFERLARAEAGSGAAEARRARIDAARRATLALPRLEEARRLERDWRSGEENLAGRRATVDAFLAAKPAIEREAESAREAARAIEGMDRELGQLTKAVEAWGRASAAQAELDSAKRAEGAARARVETAIGVESGSRLAFESARISVEDEEVLRSEMEAANQRHEAAKQVERAALELAEREAALVKSAAVLEAAKEAAVPLSETLVRLETMWDRSAASALSLRLEKGMPCPVCGSREHPAPAHETGGGFDPALLDAARKAREEGLSRVAGAASGLEAETAARGRASIALRERVGEGRELPDVAMARELRLVAEEGARNAARRIQDLREARKKAEALALALDKATSEKGKAEKALATLREALVRNEEAYTAAHAQAGGVDPRSALQKLIRRRELREESRRGSEAKSRAWQEDFASAEALRVDAETRLPLVATASEEAHERARMALQESGFGSAEEARAAAPRPGELAELEGEQKGWEGELAAARAAAEEAGRAVGGGAAADLAALEAARSAAELALETAQAELAELREDRQRLEALIARRIAVAKERAELDATSGRLAALSALLAGELQPRRLPFKNFVLAAYFRAVVDRASLRLAELSDGRYHLVADEGQSGGRGRVGLEIQVRDSFTGRSRSAGSLSGGERFLSSLALALGLADTIRSRSGGVSLDSVFIDEGFGSLDEETLDRAIVALDRARGERTIGIVSHVAELRARIPSRIEVRKGREGSSLVIV